MNPEGGAYCRCREGRESFKGKCEHLFLQGSCKEGEVLIPRQQDCPSRFSCKAINNCPGYKETKKYLEKQRNEKLEFLKLLICKSELHSRAICCPDYDDKSLLSPITIIRALDDNPGVECMKNTCPEGSWPWIEDDVSVCKESDSTVLGCKQGLEEKEGILTCKSDSLITFHGLFIGKQNCGRRRRFRYGKCVRIFRGK